jgi:O-antigen/teichoic acid export membrane protein
LNYDPANDHRSSATCFSSDHRPIMSSIRRQSLISSGVVYIGFAVGLLNFYFFGKEGLFTSTEYGLTNMFIAIATLMMAFSILAMPVYIVKFYPYYKDNLTSEKNDMLSIALVASTIAFLLVIIAGWVFRHLVIRKFGANSPELIQYYKWVFPMGFGLTIYSILEAYAWSIHKPVLASFLKEVQWRLLTTVLIVLFIFKIIPSFDLFIKLYAFTYPAIAVTLLLYLLFTKRLKLTLSISKVTRRYAKKIIALCAFAYSGTLIFHLSQVFDSLVIGAVLDNGLEKVGIFGLATILTSVIQAPQRAIVATAISHLSRAWKERNMALLQKVYQRSSINLLIFASGIFLLMVLNYKEVILTIPLKSNFLLGFNAFIFLGLTRVVDLGTGVNAEIIATSNYWRFQLVCGVVLLTLMLPLTYLLAKEFDILGPAIAQLISMAIYNAMRIIFLWKKFRLFPFTMNSLWTLVLGVCAFALCHYLFRNLHGYTGLILRSVVFLAIYGSGVLYLKLSPDIAPVVESIRKRIRI